MTSREEIKKRALEACLKDDEHTAFRGDSAKVCELMLSAYDNGYCDGYEKGFRAAERETHKNHGGRYE